MILPHRQKTAGEVCGIGHRDQYTRCREPEYQFAIRWCVFDNAIPPKACIVAAEGPSP